MRPTMYGQGTALNEGLLTRFVVAGIWPLVGVNPIVSLQVGLSIEALCLQSVIESL